MDTSIEYRLMCSRSKEVQDMWEPEMGDFFLSKASYCEKDNCSVENLCVDCLNLCNEYVIAGKYGYSEGVGGTHWFYGGGLCVRGNGHKAEDTHCSVITRGSKALVEGSTLSKHVWMPRQDQTQEMLFQELNSSSKMKRFLEWVDNVHFSPHSYSLEMLWLMFYMKEIHNKAWNSYPNIRQWDIA